MTYNKEWYQRNKEARKVYRQEYKKKNPEKVRTWYEQAFKNRLDRMQNDPEFRKRALDARKKWENANPEKMKAIRERRAITLQLLPQEEKQRRRAKTNISAKKYYQRHSEEAREYGKQYRVTHAKEISARRKRRYAEDPTYNRVNKIFSKNKP